MSILPARIETFVKVVKHCVKAVSKFSGSTQFWLISLLCFKYFVRGCSSQYLQINHLQYLLLFTEGCYDTDGVSPKIHNVLHKLWTNKNGETECLLCNVKSDIQHVEGRVRAKKSVCNRQFIVWRQFRYPLFIILLHVVLSGKSPLHKKVFLKDFFSSCEQFRSFQRTTSKEILNGTVHSLRSVLFFKT